MAINARTLLQVGYDCGLDTIGEAYSMVLSHYDAFFIIENIENELEELHQELKYLDILNADINIIDAANKINYTLLELEIPEPNIEESTEDVLWPTFSSPATGI